MADFRIVLTGHGRGEVYRNGELISDVTDVKVEAGVNSLTQVTLTLAAADVVLEVQGAEEAIVNG